MTNTVDYERPALWDVIERGGKPYRPLYWQAKHIHSRTERFIIAACGRRAGKTSAMKGEIAREIVKPAREVMGIEKPPLIYVIGPTTEASMKVWQPVWDLFVPPESGNFSPPLGFMHESHDKNRRYIRLINGVELYGKTADDPTGLQGDPVSLAITDESQDIKHDAWAVLVPGLADTQGRLFAIGIPRGKGTFRSYWELGQGADPNFYSCNVPTSANPLFLDLAREAGYGDDVTQYLRENDGKLLTDEDFDRMYLAKWVEQDGQVFKDLSEVFTAPGSRPHARHENVMGLDIGKLHDFTVAYIGDLKTSTFIAGDRFNGLDYTVAVPRIAKLYRAFACEYIHMDVTGVGEAVADMLRKEGCNVIPFKFTNESKSGLISTFAREVERGQVSLLKEDTILRREMEMFEAEVSGTTVKYNAPKGYFDDCVIAAALLVQKMAQRHSYASNPQRKPYVTFGAPIRKRVA